MAHPSAPLIPSVAEVYCENSGRLGTLSYLVPNDLEVRLGDAVRVPFGKQERNGVVVGPGDPSLATRPILEVFGPRARAAEIALAADLAAEHAAPFTSVIDRLAPRTKRGNPPLDAGLLTLQPGLSYADLGFEPLDHPRLVLACAPLVPLSRVAALEVQRLLRAAPSVDDIAPQVLVICPTKEHITSVMKEFASGAARLDVSPKKNDPSSWRGMVEGTLRVGVGSRSAALWSVRNLAGIVVVDEGHPGFQESVQPHTNAALVAGARALRASLPCSFVATVPTPAVLGMKVKCQQVGGKAHFPKVVVLDRTSAPPSERLVPPSLSKVLKDRVLPTKALAPARDQRYKCPSCKSLAADAAPCRRCGTTPLPTAFDPERTKLVLAPVVDVESVTLSSLLATPGPSTDPQRVILFDIDALTRLPELHASLTAATALHAACRLAGAGEVVILTSDPGAPAVEHLARRKDLRSFAQWMWNDAKKNELPPLVRLARIEVNRASPPRAPEVGRVLGPRKKDDQEWEIVVLLSNTQLPDLHKYLERLRRAGKVRFTLT